MRLEQLVPYFRGARFAVVALRRRHPETPGLDSDAQRYIDMLDRYSEAAIATFRLKRAQGQASGPR
jgi:hypothetical protein